MQRQLVKIDKRSVGNSIPALLLLSYLICYNFLCSVISILLWFGILFYADLNSKTQYMLR